MGFWLYAVLPLVLCIWTSLLLLFLLNCTVHPRAPAPGPLHKTSACNVGFSQMSAISIPSQWSSRSLWLKLSAQSYLPGEAYSGRPAGHLFLLWPCASRSPSSHWGCFWFGVSPALGGQWPSRPEITLDEVFTLKILQSWSRGSSLPSPTWTLSPLIILEGQWHIHLLEISLVTYTFSSAPIIASCRSVGDRIETK